jgi:hypothetical protein
MQSENPLIADFVKMANSAAGTFAGMTREAREQADALETRVALLEARHATK